MPYSSFLYVSQSAVSSLVETGLRPVSTSKSMSNETADWETYRNEEYGYSVSYPADWDLFEEPVEASRDLIGNELQKVYFTKNYISYVRVIVSLIKSHKLAYKKIKELNSDTQVGVAKNNQYFDSDKNPINILIRIFIVWFRNKMFLNAISEHQDFIGLNHYFYRKFGGNSELSKSDMGWAIYPPAIYFVLKELVKYKKPIYITENGIADAKDLKRADFIRDYIDYVKKSIDEGVNVRGYFYWSLLDNYEWSFGFDKRFGLVEVDYGTMERKIRPSAYVYKGIIENGL